MMGKNKKPSEYQITKNLRLYRCRDNKNAKSSLEGDTVHSGDTVTLFHAARASAVWDTSEK